MSATSVASNPEWTFKYQTAMKRRKLSGRREVADDDEDNDDEPLPPDADWDREESQGPAFPVRSLVVGGKEAARRQFPFQAGLLVQHVDPDDGTVRSARCAAVLLSDRWLLTAAHCCRKGNKIRVFLGSHLTMQDAEQQLDTTLVLLHPLYSRERPGHNDLALIRLPKQVHFTDKVRPIRLPSWSQRALDFAGKVATLSGWGKTSDTDNRPQRGTAVLRFAKERILTHAEAEAILERKLPPTFLCVRGLQGEVSCNGDSGGPLTVEGADGRPVLVGVVSHRYGLFCSTSKAHVCTRVTSFLPWIAAITRVPIEH